MIRTALAALLLATTAHATLRTITVHGEFRQQRGSAAAYFGLSLPIPFTFFVQYDDEAPNTGTSTIASYETGGAYWGLSFGSGLTFHFFTGANTEVRVWNTNFQAVSFGNDDAFSRYGLFVEAYRCYGFFSNVFSPVPGWDASLHWISEMAGDGRFETNSYVFIAGNQETPAWTETLLQTSTPQHYNVD